MSTSTLNGCFHEYLKNIAVTKEVADLLEDARKKVKSALAKGIREQTEKQGERVIPRFMRQGSAGYGTQNMPYNPPQQQVDFDYGCYLPLSYLEDGSGPRQAASDFFDMVDSILKPLARDNGWKSAEKGKKSYCITLNDEVHFDVPLYSAPPEKFKEIHDQSVAFESVGFSRSDEEETEETWDDLPTDSIMLAYRDDDGVYRWKASDPRLLNMYFIKKTNSDKAIYRILKGWRDFLWNEEKGPSSIFLMSLAEKVNGKRPFLNDIETELQKVLVGIEKLNLPLNEDNCGEVCVENPADPSDTIKCSKKDFNRLKLSASGFCGAIQMNNWNSLPEVCMVLRMSHLGNHDNGNRFPDVKDSYTPNFRQPPRTTRAG